MITTADLTPETLRSTIESMIDTRDVRYFDSSQEGLAKPRNAGEVIRREQSRQALAESMTGAEDAIRNGLRLALPNMEQRDLVYVAQALDNCPVLK